MFAICIVDAVHNGTVMKFNLIQSDKFVLLVLSLFSVLVFSTVHAYADVREDAEAAVSRLHQNDAAQKFSGDMKALELVLELAQLYFSNENFDTADKYYLLALQKSQIIDSMIKRLEAVPSADVADQRAPQDRTPSGETTVAGMPTEPVSDKIVGTKGVYTVVKSDTIRLVAAKLGVTRQHLIHVNGLDPKAYLKIGQKLAYDNRKIIPQQMRDGIVINIADRTLYYFQRGALVTSLPVAVGSATNNEKFVWQTPVGKFKITAKEKDPTWTVPPSIQTEMEENGKEVVASVPPGPENPLGKYAIKTSLPGILIHSTIRPSSIYSFSSHGCIRISPDQMEELYPKIKVNTRGEIVYKPVKLAVTDDRRVYLEVHDDVYKKSVGLVEEARQLVEKQNLSKLVDWGKFKSVVKQKSGIAEDISL